ncbi:MAG TPA: hypothetical protein PLO62_08720 [Candidatus Hydrogenedentes bacterium]|nr:hypothetical protein [Candidatus Hydrogenedentota bacterium]HOS02873.1 hypothetical protein [Candidatus Hydrogenedentota bacterium]
MLNGDGVMGRFAPLALFLLLLAVYLINGDLLVVNDATPNLYLPVSLVREGNVTFTPDEYPFMFIWNVDTPAGQQQRLFPPWDMTFQGASILDLHRAGKARVKGGIYMAVESVREGQYVNFFGLGTGISALPVIGPLTGVLGDWHLHQAWLWQAGKCIAAAYAAGSAALLVLVARSLIDGKSAFLVALAYGLGTCVWSVSSQGLTQHAPNEFFLMLGTFFLTRVGRDRRQAAFSAAAYAWAVWCRPTSALVVCCALGYLVWKDRRALVPFMVTGLPFAVALGVYNAYYLGSPFRFGQTVGGEMLAEIKTGSPEVWQTPLWEGLAGHLVSPSRGLFVFSPFLLFAVWGAVRAWKRPEFAALRPLLVATALMLLVESKHFDWWSGLSYGYRHIVDLMPFAALSLVPVMPDIRRRRLLLAVFVALLAWSVGVQFLGAFAYDINGWNRRVATTLRLPDRADLVVVADREEVERLKAIPGVMALSEEGQDVDSPRYRHRLWSWRDNQIGYHALHFTEGRMARRAQYEPLLHPR